MRKEADEKGGLLLLRASAEKGLKKHLPLLAVDMMRVCVGNGHRAESQLVDYLESSSSLSPLGKRTLLAGKNKITQSAYLPHWKGSVCSFLHASAPVPERCEKVEPAHHLHALLNCLHEETQRMAGHQSHQRKSSSHGQPAAYESHGAMNMAQHRIITLLKIS